LIAPFQRFRTLLTVVMVFTALQALTLTAAAQGALADVDIGWLPALSNTVLAAAVLLLAIGNLAAPSLRRRWFIAAVIGALGGFGLGRLLSDAWPFAGPHMLVAVASFNVGVLLGEVVSLAISIFALCLFFARALGPLLGVIVLSALLGHASWHWMIDGGFELRRQIAQMQPAGLWSTLVVLAPWLVPALLVGVLAYFLPRRFDGVPGPTLLRALRGHNTDESPARV
jgi:hypothetical protein